MLLTVPYNLGLVYCLRKSIGLVVGKILIPSRIMAFSVFFKEEWNEAKRICRLSFVSPVK